MKPNSNQCKAPAWPLARRLLLLATLGLFLYPLVWPAGESLYVRWCLWDARSVQLVHFNPYTARRGHELIYATKDLTREEVSAVAGAFPICFDMNYMLGGLKKCTFDPHHRILITSRLGFNTLIRVCFICEQVQVGGIGYPFEMPSAWSTPLHKLFTDEGMPFNPELYRKDFQDEMQRQLPP